MAADNTSDQLGNLRYVQGRYTTAGGAGEEVNRSGGSCVGRISTGLRRWMAAPAGGATGTNTPTVAAASVKRAATSYDGANVPAVA